MRELHADCISGRKLLANNRPAKVDPSHVSPHWGGTAIRLSGGLLGKQHSGSKILAGDSFGVLRIHP